MQIRLLRVLQEKQIEPLGAVQTVKVDVRAVAATNQDLETLVKEIASARQKIWGSTIVRYIAKSEALKSKRLQPMDEVVMSKVINFSILRPIPAGR